MSQQQYSPMQQQQFSPAQQQQFQQNQGQFQQQPFQQYQPPQQQYAPQQPQQQQSVPAQQPINQIQPQGQQFPGQQQQPPQHVVQVQFDEPKGLQADPIPPQNSSQQESKPQKETPKVNNITKVVGVLNKAKFNNPLYVLYIPMKFNISDEELIAKLRILLKNDNFISLKKISGPREGSRSGEGKVFVPESIEQKEYDKTIFYLFLTPENFNLIKADTCRSFIGQEACLPAGSEIKEHSFSLHDGPKSHERKIVVKPRDKEITKESMQELIGHIQLALNTAVRSELIMANGYTITCHLTNDVYPSFTIDFGSLLPIEVKIISKILLREFVLKGSDKTMFIVSWDRNRKEVKDVQKPKQKKERAPKQQSQYPQQPYYPQQQPYQQYPPQQQPYYPPQYPPPPPQQQQQQYQQPFQQQYPPSQQYGNQNRGRSGPRRGGERRNNRQQFQGFNQDAQRQDNGYVGSDGNTVVRF